MDLNQLKSLKEKVSNRLIRVNTQIKRIERKIERIDTDFNAFNRKAKTAVRHGEDELAERILKKKNHKMDQITNLENHLSKLRPIRSELIELKNEIDVIIEQTSSANKNIALEKEFSVPEMPKIPSAL